MDQIIGQQHAVDTLMRQFATDRLHHAYIFHGPMGVGKCTMAIAFAQLLLCHGPQRDLQGQFAACGRCASCQLLHEPTEGEADDDEPAALHAAHPDLHIVRKELAQYSEERTIRDRKLTQIPVEVVRDHLLEPVTRGAKLGHGRVFIVDEAELLNDTGQNLMLKTLEEPPAGTVLILVTSSEDRLLPTIRSRCQRLGFHPLNEEAMQRWLALRDVSLDAEARDWLLQFAAGSPGRAELALRYELIGWAGKLLPAIDATVAGREAVGLGQQIASAIDTFAQSWVDAHKGASKEAANRLAAQLMGALIAGHASRRLAEDAHRVTADAGAAEAEATLSPWLNVIDAVTRMQTLLSSNVNLSLACDELAVTIRGAGASV